MNIRTSVKAAAEALLHKENVIGVHTAALRIYTVLC